MATMQEKARFIAGVAGKSQDFGKQLELRDERSLEIDRLVGSGLDGSRDDLRNAMTFSIQRRDGKGDVQSMDERGQRKSIETEDARSSYESIDPKDYGKVMKALERIIAIKQQMQQAMSKDGKPLFTSQDIVAELFTPLVREGLLPENLVIDGDSEVATMLREVIKSFKDMLREQENAKREAAAKAESDFNNAGTKMDRAKALGSKVGNFAKAQVSAIASKTGMTDEEFGRAQVLAGKTLSTANSIRKGVSAGMGVDKVLDGVAGTRLTEKLDGVGMPSALAAPLFNAVGDKLQGIDSGPLNNVLNEVAMQLSRAGIAVDEFVKANGDRLLKVLGKFAKLIESDGIGIAGDVASVLMAGVPGGIEMGTKLVGGRVEAGGDIDVAVRRGGLRSGLNGLGLGVEQQLRRALLPYGVAMSDAAGAGFSQAFAADKLFDIVEPALKAKPDTPPQGAAVVALVAVSLAQALASIDGALKQHGEALAKAFTSAAGSEISRLGALFKLGALPDPAGMFDGLLPLVGQVAAGVFDDQSFQSAITDKSVTEKIDNAAKQGNQAQEDELDAAQEELDDFERQLVLIDEGGMELARQQSLDVMIAQLKADQLDLQIVLKAGSLLSGFGGAVTKMGTDSANVANGVNLTDQTLGRGAKTVATKVAESVIPALQAAQLVMQMSVTIVKIARRAELARKFKADVDKARKAGSMLMPSIDNFYSAKVQQQVYASIELALQTVQLAGAICSSVPEPITMAVGRALSAAASAAESARDLIKTAHDEASLRKGWKITLEAINNPANRRSGLDALRHNATLAVHSIAWAATNGDPMANEILRSCNVDAQTMADEGSDKDKVIEYLETLLNEDLQFKDAAKLNIDWVPQPLELSFAGWFTLKSRARRANPPLDDAETAQIDARLKALSLQPRLHSIVAHPLDHKDSLARFKAETEAVRVELEKYKPMAADRSPHGEMAAACRSLVAMAAGRVGELEQLERTIGGG